LEQRNNYLKQIKLENKPASMLDIWDEHLAEYSYKIFEYRKYFIEKIEAPTRHYNYTKEYVDYDTALEILRRIRDEEVIPLQFAWYYRNYKYQTSEFMRNNLVAEGRKKALKTIVELCRY
jgi:hypothetical protein